MSPIFTSSKFGFLVNKYEPTFDPFFSNVSMLLHMDGADTSTTFTDSSLNALPITRSGAFISTVQSKFGGSSAFLTGGYYLDTVYNSAIDLIGNRFTVEAWIYPTSILAGGTRIASAAGGTVAFNSTTGIHWLLQLVNTGNLQLQVYTVSGAAGLTGSQLVNLNSWNHVAVSVIGSTVYLGVNGLITSSTLPTFQRPSTNPTLRIGLIPNESGGGGTGFAGHIDEFRITKGTARYTSIYSIPGAPFPNL